MLYLILQRLATLQLRQEHMANLYSSMYNYRWQRYRLQFLKSNPLCVECDKLGKLTLATVVDHIQKHEGDTTLFWDESNHQALCKHCHDSYKQTLEKSGYAKGGDMQGIPLDPNHAWNK